MLKSWIRIQNQCFWTHNTDCRFLFFLWWPNGWFLYRGRRLAARTRMRTARRRMMTTMCPQTRRRRSCPRPRSAAGLRRALPRLRRPKRRPKERPQLPRRRPPWRRRLPPPPRRRYQSLSSPNRPSRPERRKVAKSRGGFGRPLPSQQKVDREKLPWKF